MFWDNYVYYCNKIGKSPNTVAWENGVHSTGTVTGWKKGAIPRNPMISSLAKYFGITVDDLLGEREIIQSVMLEISKDGQRIGRLYDKATETDQMLVESVLDKYEQENITVIPRKKKNPGGFIEFDVYDEPAAAGLGNYLDSPQCHREQFPAPMIPKGANFGIRISGNSMEPDIPDGSTVFVQSVPSVEDKKIGIFILNGKSFCKQLVIDKAKKEIRLHSLNPDYKDIIVTPYDDLRTVGMVL